MINKEEFDTNRTQFTNEKLCEIIVAYRYLGIMKDQAIAAMEELATRRTNGDQFQYEARINDLMRELPSIDIDMKKMIGNLGKK